MRVNSTDITVHALICDKTLDVCVRTNSLTSMMKMGPLSVPTKSWRRGGTKRMERRGLGWANCCETKRGEGLCGEEDRRVSIRKVFKELI